MIILRMTACFGRLENETLTLTPGLNVLSQANESGKSTWTAFLLAMLYGIDTTQRAKQGVLPAKTKYKPWSGKPMQGTLEVQLPDGRRIRIERSTRGRTPMGEFSAVDMDTGLAVPELTADNCGEMLLGVTRSVFERSALIHQSNLAVTSDEALDRRLSSLVTTGDEHASAFAAAKLLHEQKIKIQHNQTGALPQARREREQLCQRLAQIHALHHADLALSARRLELEKRRGQLRLAQQALRVKQQQQKQQQLLKAQQTAQLAAQELELAQEKTKKYPSAQQLQQMQQSLSALLREAPAPLPAAPEQPSCPAVFQGLGADEALERAQRDAQSFDRLTAGTRPKYLPALLAAIAALVAAVVCFVLKKPLPGAIIAAVGALAAFAALRLHRAAVRFDRNAEAAQALLSRYGVSSRDALVLRAAQYRDALLRYSQQKAGYDEALRRLQDEEKRRSERLAALLGAVSVFAPGEKSAADALRAIEQAQQDYAALQQAQHSLDVAQNAAATLRQAFGTLEPAPMPPGNWDGLDEQQLLREQRQLEDELQRVGNQLAESSGRVSALGDAAGIQAQIEALDETIATLSQRYAAIELAEQTLSAVDRELQTRFAPQLAGRTAELFSALTLHRYDRVLLDRALNLSAGQTGESGMHQILSLSSGTADQLYLAARLAICELALPEHAPCVLDDALLSFDDARMEAAMQLLQQQSHMRQILLFSCHTREAAWLSAQS